MKLPGYMDARDIARAMGGLSVVEEMLERERAERDRMLLGNRSILDSYRDMAETARFGELEASGLLGSMTAVEAARIAAGCLDSYKDLAETIRFGELDTSRLLGSMTAVEAARIAGHLDLPGILEQYRQADVALASQLVDAYRTTWWMDSHLEALNVHAALSDMLDETRIVGREALLAIESVLSTPIHGLDSVRQARQFLDISGLLRFPRFRRLTSAEKKRRVKRLLKESAPTAPVRKAHSLIHRHELVLRDVIAQCMEAGYGEDWAAERLPECGCKKLLGKQLESDEIVLDHADYKHYAAIVSHADHFDAVFAKGFGRAEEIRGIILRVGQLRALAHHARKFTAEDLRELVMLLRIIEAGLTELVDDVVLDP